jgi:hypothetical protein
MAVFALAAHAGYRCQRTGQCCRAGWGVALRDARGTFVTLSHYCPTAARSLVDAGPLAIVEAPPALPDDDYDGLDASGELPPLLHSSMLMDLEGYAAWEARMVATLDAAPTPPAALDTLRADAAAHAFASWCAYRGRGVRTLVRSLDAALAVLAVEAARLARETGRAPDADLLVEAFGAADLHLRHEADRQALADAWAAAERHQA